MKRAFKIIALGAAIAASTTFAKADSITGQISVEGADSFNPSMGTITFPADGNYEVNGTSTGTLSVFTAGNPVTFLPGITLPFTLPLGVQSTHTPPGGQIEILSTTENDVTLDFYLTSESWSVTDKTINGTAYQDLEVSGGGFFTETGFDQTPASFDFTTQEVNGNTTTNVTFSGTGSALNPTPEPSSLALLGTTLLGAAAFARRRYMSRLSA